VSKGGRLMGWAAMTDAEWGIPNFDDNCER
jgi:hypothetical protein